MRWRQCGELATDIGQQPELRFPHGVEWWIRAELREPD